MARLKLRNDHIDALEDQTTKAYHLLKKEIQTRGKCDLSLAVDSYHELKDSLVDIAGYSSGRRSFMSWNRGTHRAHLLDRYLLQYVLGHSLAVGFQRYGTIFSFPNGPSKKTPLGKEVHLDRYGRIYTPAEVDEADDLEETIILTIDDKKTGYASITKIAQAMARRGYFDRLLTVLEDVRALYRKPDGRSMGQSL
ncbi:hypothetical protein HYT52_05010 [Candidatus Woesearchaeota archaeon]|nr:hypothetical protein [Candidatus Woesearchaeota archaeon]